MIVPPTGAGTLLARRYRVFVWVSPLLLLSWISLAIVDPDSGPHELGIGYFFGSLFCHATLAAALAAFGPGVFAWRFPLSMAWVLSLPAAVAINIALNGGPDDGVVVVGGAVLGLWLVLQFPLWALAMGSGLHLRHTDDAERGEGGSPIRFGIRHLLIIMFIAGVVLGIGRVTVSNVKISGGAEISIFVFLVGAAIVVNLPLLLAALMRRLAVPGVLLALLFIGAVTNGELPLLTELGLSGPEMHHLITINVASAALVLASVLIVRLNGFCFYTRARGAKP
jgi:hypothetical protein